MYAELTHDRLTDEELDFLVKKDERETRNFYRVISIFMSVCFIIPFIVAWGKALGGDEETPFSFKEYFLWVFYLLCFLAFCAWFVYSRTLGKVKSDIKHRAKTVEKTKITRKQHVRSGGSYYFYLDSPNKLTIEVEESDYYSMNEGDELNIEYSTKAKLYFGYF